MSDRIVELFSDGPLGDRVEGLPRLARIAVAARAGRYAQEVLTYELRLKADTAAAEHLLRRCEELAQRGGTLTPAANDELSIEVFNKRRQNSPRPAVWEAVNSIGAACSCAAAGSLGLSRMSARNSVLHARNAWLQGLISPSTLGALELEQLPRPGVTARLTALAADIQRICELALVEHWADETTVSPGFWEPTG